MQRADAVSPVLVNVIQGMVIMILIAFDATAATGMRTALFGHADNATTSADAIAEAGDA
jgi:hypothetical protein